MIPPNGEKNNNAKNAAICQRLSYVPFNINFQKKGEIARTAGLRTASKKSFALRPNQTKKQAHTLAIAPFQGNERPAERS